MTFGSFLLANACRRSPLRRRLALGLSAAAHAGLLLAAVLLHVSPPSRRPPPSEPIVLRLPRLGRPPAQRPAAPPPVARPPRRPPRPVAIVQPREQPPPAPELLPEPPPEPAAEEPSNPDDRIDAGPPEPGPSGPPVHDGGSALAVDSDGVLDLRQVARAPAVLAQVKPDYPREARWKRLEGLVVVRVVIGIDGLVDRSRTRVVRSIPELDAAAIAALEQWRFSPAIGHSGQPVRVVIEVPVRFSLR
jgi:periplasmic protein TonB